MAIEQQTEKADLFQHLLTQHYQSGKDTGPLKAIKEKAWDRFLHVGLPSRDNESYRYLHLRHLFAQSYSLSAATQLSKEQIDSFVYPESKKSFLVFSNGHFQPHLSCWEGLPSQIVIAPLNDAMRSFGSFINQQSMKLTKEETDSFAILNAALHRDGAFIYIPPKTISELPIQILNLIDIPNDQMLVLPRIQLFVGAQSEAVVVNSFAQLSDKGYCLNQVMDVSLEEDAKLQVMQNSTNHHPRAWNFDALRVQQKRNSRFISVLATEGASTVRNDYKIALAGENAEVRLNGVWNLSDKREAHTHIVIDHQAPHCRSMQLFKGVLNDFSRSSFEGKILVQQIAQKTEAFQLNQNLILSDNAHADSKPNLEIFADDVKASHGATVGQLDPEQLFYMQTRGFDSSAAKSMLVYSYCKEVIDLIPTPSLQQALTHRLK